MQVTDLYREEENTVQMPMLRIGADGAREQQSRTLLREGLLEVSINERLSMKLVCTRTDLAALVIGHLYTEGRITSTDELRTVYICAHGARAKVFTARPIDTPDCPIEVRACDCAETGILDRDFSLGSAAGAWVLPDFQWEEAWIFDLVRAFSEGAELFEKTHGIHSCYLMYEGEIKYICEDIGRHNALDKAVGRALMDGVDLTRCILFSSGRIPDDMMEKTIRARVPVLVSNGVPTDRAVELARRYHVTLICRARREGFDVFSCRELWEK